MTRTALVTLDWADGTYDFRLGWGELIMIQEACDAGPHFILNSLYNQTWRVEHISHIIRCALIGGGKTPAQALKLTRTYVETRVPMENLMIAQAILTAALAGVPEEDPGAKKEDAVDQENDSTIYREEKSE